MEDKNQNIEFIEQKINEIKKAVISGFDQRAEDLRYAQEQGLVQFTAELTDVKNNMLKDLDDRLVLIKQFPSVLDADQVKMFELTDKGTKEIRDNWGRLNMYLDDGKWKVLILAKKIL